MWPFKKTAISRTIETEEMPEWIAIQYWQELSNIGQWFYRMHMYESQRYVPSDKRGALPLRALMGLLGAVGRLEKFPNQSVISQIEDCGNRYNSLLHGDILGSSISIHPNITSFLAAPENISQPVLYTLFRKLSGRRLDEGDIDLFRDGIARDLFDTHLMISGIAGYPQPWPNSRDHKSFSGVYAKIEKEFHIWSMSVLPLTYEYFDAMKVAEEYARVRPLEAEIPAICMHPMCRKKFKIDSRITDLFKFSFWDETKFIASFCSDAHALAARENGINALRAHVDFVSHQKESLLRIGQATPQNQLVEDLAPDLQVSSWRTYTEYPLCKSPFYVEYHRLLHSVYDDSTWDSRYVDDNIMTPLEISNIIHRDIVPILSSWRLTFIEHNLYAPMDDNDPEKVKKKYQEKEIAILNMIRKILLRESHYRAFPLEKSFPKYY